MPHAARRRVIAGASILMGLVALAGCRPNVPLIPGIQSDVQPFGTMSEITPPDRCLQAAPTPRHTAP